MANLPQSQKLKKLNLVMHECGRLYSAKPGAFCSRCGPDKVETKTCKRGHERPATEKRCKECDKAARRKPAAQTEPFEDSAPVISDKQRAENVAAAEERAARRAGLGRPDTLALPL